MPAFRYLAFVWHDLDATAREAARRLIERHSSSFPGWLVAVGKKGLYVGYAGAMAGSSELYLLADGAGVVLGRLFERARGLPSSPARLTFDEQETRALVATGRRRVIDRYWGRYVAFLHDTAASTTWVLRDPSAGLPCLSVEFGGVTLYFSSMEEVLHLGLGPFTVNWGFLAASVCMMRPQARATGLCEVKQVLGGECMELRARRRSSTFYWDPLQIASSGLVEDPVAAAATLRNCVQDSVHAWASGYRGILLSLSGGLDSSIVFACLRDAPTKPDLACFHYYPIGSDMDERRFARLVAESGRRELIERPRDPTLSLEPLLQLRPSHAPSDYLYYLEHGRPNAQLAGDHHAAAIFVGWGGDQLFYQARAVWAAGDYLHHHGLRPEVFRVAMHSARMDRVSVWHVLREAFTQYVLRRRWSLGDYPPQASPQLVRPDIVEEVKGSAEFVHPLLLDPRGTPSGKLWHVYQLSGPWEFYDPFGRPGDPEQVAPLYSQPVIELCLRIPTYVLTSGGWDRAIARAAFYRDLPGGILSRISKGRVEDHVNAILECNAALLRDLLLDGLLVTEGLVDRDKLTTTLSGRAASIQVSSSELLDCLSAEAWLRQWGKHAWRAAA